MHRLLLHDLKCLILRVIGSRRGSLKDGFHIQLVDLLPGNAAENGVMLLKSGENPVEILHQYSRTQGYSPHYLLLNLSIIGRCIRFRSNLLPLDDIFKLARHILNLLLQSVIAQGISNLLPLEYHAEVPLGRGLLAALRPVGRVQSLERVNRSVRYALIQISLLAEKLLYQLIRVFVGAIPPHLAAQLAQIGLEFLFALQHLLLMKSLDISEWGHPCIDLIQIVLDQRHLLHLL